MRTTRTLAMITAGLVAAGSLSACGGGPEPLDQAGSKEVLLSAEDFPLDGFEQGSIKEGANDAETDPQEMTKAFEELGGLGEKCKKTFEEIGAMNATEYMESQSSAEYTKGDDQSVDLMVGGTKKDGQDFVDAFKKIGAECEDMETELQGMPVKTSFEEISEDNFAGTAMKMEVAGQSIEMLMGGKKVGDNLVMAFSQGVSKDDVAKVLEAQAKAVEDK